MSPSSLPTWPLTAKRVSVAEESNEAGASDNKEVPVCASCGRPTDDIEGMDEQQLLEAIHIGVLRDLARSVRSGNASHQELAIARGLLRDNNKKIAPADDGVDDTLPGAGRVAMPRREFPDYGHDE